jgi:hypothetical protein
MEPTEKLVRYLRLAGLSQTLDISNIIAECIADGAVLNGRFRRIDDTDPLKVPPIFYAMCYLCPLNIVKQLKDAWWDDNYFYIEDKRVLNHTCCCINDADLVTVKYTPPKIMNELYSYAKYDICNNNVNIINRTKEYTQLFGYADIHDDDNMRLEYILHNHV